MTEKELFKQATKRKIRYATQKGLVTVEDLWDLPLTSRSGPSLDGIATALDAELSTTTKSFVTKTSTKNATLEIAFEIVKVVIEDRLKAKEVAEKRVESDQRRARIRQLLDNKKDEELAGKSVEELEAMLED